MKILLDENISYSLSKEFPWHECYSVAHMGWRGIGNGKLLALAQGEGFDVLISLDDDMRTEQDLVGMQISVLILRPVDQGLGPIRALAPAILTALTDIQQGTFLVVS